MVKIPFWSIILSLFSLFVIFLHSSYIFTAFLIAFVLLLFCKQRLEYCRTDQTESKHVALGLKFHLNPGQREIDRGKTQNRVWKKSRKDHWQKPFVGTGILNVYNTVDSDTFTMWGNSSFSSPKSQNRLNASLNTSSPRSGRTSLNATMPIQASSPTLLRQRKQNVSSVSDKRSMLSAAGPLLSSPFMPQIKRALGLEPKTQLNYSQRRHSTSLNTSLVASPASPGALPHVRLNKSTRPSLSDRNSSMLNRSSTVKIAPPVSGRVASPSLHQMRNDSMTVEERGTPDTYAVISALKERRKRSINPYEETQEYQVPHAKRRRQESQQSNASTSSMPSLPDNLPDLTNTDFTMRLETPGGIKRPSRPSQEDAEEWQNQSTLKRLKGNNSILSSLSSSQRFINTQVKRKSNDSFSEKENNRSLLSKTPRSDPPKLTHISLTLDADRSQSLMPGVQQSTVPLTNGHAEPGKVSSSTDRPEQLIPQADKDSRTSNTVDSPRETLARKISDELNGTQRVAEGSTPTKRFPSMKKTASVYSGLGKTGSFSKAQYANVVATIDDYDLDREAEQNRVTQMLQDIDKSFSQEAAKKTAVMTTSSSIIGTMSAPVSSLATVATVTAASISTASALSALEKLSKSPLTGQADKDPKTPALSVVTGKTTNGSPVASPSDSSNQPKAGDPPSYFAAVSAGSHGLGSVTQSTSLSLTGSTTLLPAGIQSVSTAASGFTLGQLLASTQSGTGVSSTLPTSTTSPLSSLGSLPAPATSATPAIGGFSFGASTGAPATTAVSSSAGPAVGGFSFGASAPAPAPSDTTATAGLGSNAGFFKTPASSAPVAVASSAASGGGFSFGSSVSAPTTKPASTGISFGTPANTATTGTPGFGTSTSTPAFGGFGNAAAPTTGGFSFGSMPSAALTTSSAAPGGFNLSGTTTQSATPASGFGGFGGASTTPAASSPFAGFGSGSGSAASSGSSLFAAPQSTTKASTTALGFGAGSTGLGAFGSSTTTAASATTGFSFGSSQPSTASSTPFATPASTAQAGFSFGAQAPTGGQSGFSFGGAPAPQTTTSAPPPYSFPTGSASTTPFGATTQPAAAPASFSFGQASAQNAGTAGQSGFSFGKDTGGSTSQAPAFGTGSTNPTPAFGSVNPTPAFGSGSTNQAPAFGAGSSNQTPAFGAGSSNQTPAFGAGSGFGTGTSNPSSVFGNANGASPTFAKSHSMPSFGTTDSSGTFNFGQAAPNVNPFGPGQTTPAKQTGSAFGMQSTDTTPKQQTGSMFQFGNQSSSNSNTNQGFNFAAAAGNTNQNTSAGYNFMSANTQPVFNFGSSASTPAQAFGTPGAAPTPGAFSVGTGVESARPPRIVTKARRRGQRR